MRITCLVFALFFVFLSCAPSFAQDTVHNGYWWNRLPKPFRLAYMYGVSDGVAMGKELIIAHIRDKNRTEQGLPAIVDRNFTEIQERYLANASVEQVVDGLNKFYFNSKNRPVPINEAIRRVIQGITQPEDSPEK
ncbi:MAG: hypothetical protein LLG06_02410 [Desulfobacteraceae bacterium]|nr:hypothetical protein [Desulfobacteraceae bacterium]